MGPAFAKATAGDGPQASGRGLVGGIEGRRLQATGRRLVGGALREVGGSERKRDGEVWLRMREDCRAARGMRMAGGGR